MRREAPSSTTATIPFTTATIPFTTAAELTTTSALEWEYVADPKPGRAYPSKDGQPRRPLPAAGMQSRLERMNRKLATIGCEPMSADELLATRLFDGPMHRKYMAVLRGWVPTPYELVAACYLLCAVPPLLGLTPSIAELALGEPFLGSARQLRPDRHALITYTLFWLTTLALKFAFVIIFEHVVFGVCKLIDILVPDIPASVAPKP